jgi:hypothetical protein
LRGCGGCVWLHGDIPAPLDSGEPRLVWGLSSDDVPKADEVGSELMAGGGSSWRTGARGERVWCAVVCSEVPWATGLGWRVEEAEERRWAAAWAARVSGRGGSQLLESSWAGQRQRSRRRERRRARWTGCRASRGVLEQLSSRVRERAA